MADQDFPTDETTLTLLIAACEINPDTERTHLQDFLMMGTRIKSSTDITEEVFGEKGGPPVYFNEYEEGYEPFSEHQVITTLARELLETRAALVVAREDRPAVEPRKESVSTGFPAEEYDEYPEWTEDVARDRSSEAEARGESDA